MQQDINPGDRIYFISVSAEIDSDIVIAAEKTDAEELPDGKFKAVWRPIPIMENEKFNKDFYPENATTYITKIGHKVTAENASKTKEGLIEILKDIVAYLPD